MAGASTGRSCGGSFDFFTMTVKTFYTQSEFDQILKEYSIGAFIRAEPIQAGEIQSNYVLWTEKGKFVLRYYENRNRESVLFESELLDFLAERKFPSPKPLKNRSGANVGSYKNKPFILFDFLKGRPIDHPQEKHFRQVIRVAAELQNLTRGFRPEYTDYRWNYTPELCFELAKQKACELNTQEAYHKLDWVEEVLSNLELPASLPKGICHCDFHPSNIFFREDQLAALLDFDDANFTYLPFDLVNLIDHWAWSYLDRLPDFDKARFVAKEFSHHRQLSEQEKLNLLDVYKISIVIDSIWFFSRWEGDSFYEKIKIESLNNLGREVLMNRLFLNV